MKLNQIPNLRVEDFDQAQNWLDRLFIQLNPMIQSLNQIINGGIDFTANIKSVTKDYDLTITTFQPFSFQWSFTDVPPLDLRIIKALKGGTLTPTILLPAWSYNTSNRAITVSQLVELSSTGVIALSGRYQFSARATV